MPEISAELLQGPYAGNTGRLTFKDEPPATLSFQLDSDTSDGGLILPTSSSVSDKLTVIYEQIREKPRKVLTYDDAGRARSELGVRYRYSPRLSPAQALFDQADVDAKTEESVRALVNDTRRLLLDDAWTRARAARRDVERAGDLVEAHVGRLVSVDGGKPKRFGGMRRNLTEPGVVVLTLDGTDTPTGIDTPVLLLDDRDG